MCFATGPSVRPSAYEYGVVSIVGFLTVGFNSGPRSAKYPQQNSALGFHPGLWPVKYPQWDSLLLGFTPVLRRRSVHSKIPYCCVSLRPSAGEETTAIFRTVGFNSGPRPANYPQQNSALLGFTPALGRRSIHSEIPYCWVLLRPSAGEGSQQGSALLGFTPAFGRRSIHNKIPYYWVSARSLAGEVYTMDFFCWVSLRPRPAKNRQQDSVLLGFTPALGRRSIHSWIPHCWVSFRPFAGKVSAVGFFTDGPRLNTPCTAPFLGKGSHQPACQRDLLKSNLRRYSWAACPIEQLGATQVSTNHLRPLFPGTGSHRRAFRNASWTSSSMAAKGRNETQQASMNVTSL